MTNQERDAVIMAKLNEGVSLSDVQKILADEYGLRMTYFELRMLAASLAVDWEKQDKPKVAPAPAAQAAPAAEPVAEEPAAAEEAPEAADDAEVESDVDGAAEGDAPVGETKLTLDEPPAPGTAVSGSVVFKSGASGKWALTRDGRLGFDPEEGSAEPTEEDYADFQQALRRKLSGEDEPDDPNEGPTVVDVDAVMRPGVQLSGTVTFGSGAKGTWEIGPRGLGYEPAEGSSKPTRKDIVKFQRELQRVLAQKGY